VSVKDDSRNIDNSAAILAGEGAQQEIREYGPHRKHEPSETWRQTPAAEPEDDPSYYNRALLKQPVWQWDIPAYYYLGGAAGAALALGAAAQLVRDRQLDPYIRHCRWIGVAGSTLGGALLIHDLGRPSRFLHMMRVFRPTSPMNVGAWILAGAAPFGILTAICPRKGGIVGRIGEWTGYGAGFFGLALAGYTGVLVGNTAIPVWQQSRRILPVLFYGSAVSSAASLLELTHDDPRTNRISTVFGTAGRILELTAAGAMERQASSVPRVAKSLREGVPGLLWKSAAALTLSSLVVSLVPPHSKTKRRVAGILGTLGAICLRFAIHEAGAASARDARASFHQQRG
jgi:formate-dependent nitrite reductase membrane component NrfD